MLAALNARPDDYASQYNLGNFYMQQGDQGKALAAYENAIKLRPDFVLSHVNAAFVYNAQGENDKAEASFRRAIALEPNDSAVHLNFGMLLGEMKRPAEAEQTFRRTLALDPNSAVAAYNLGVMLTSDRPFESLRWCQRAYQLHPEEGKYGYTYAFYLYQRREAVEAMKVLKDMVRRNVPYGEAYALLGGIHLKRGELDEARRRVSVRLGQWASDPKGTGELPRDDAPAGARTVSTETQRTVRKESRHGDVRRNEPWESDFAAQFSRHGGCGCRRVPGRQAGGRRRAGQARGRRAFPRGGRFADRAGMLRSQGHSLAQHRPSGRTRHGLRFRLLPTGGVFPVPAPVC